MATIARTTRQRCSSSSSSSSIVCAPVCSNTTSTYRQILALQQRRSASTSSRKDVKGKARESSAGMYDEIAKQLGVMQLIENRKSALPIKADQRSVVFATYVRPRKHGFSILSEKWVTLQAGRFLNWYQSTQAYRQEFGLLSGLKEKFRRGKRLEVLEESITPLYKALCEARARGDAEAHVWPRLGPTIVQDIADARVLRNKTGQTWAWRWHKLNDRSVESVRQMELSPGKPVMQMIVRFDSMQSLEMRDASGRLLPESGSHDAPLRVIENWVFQRSVSQGSTAPWRAIKAVPTLTPELATGDESGVRTKRRREPSLTVVG